MIKPQQASLVGKAGRCSKGAAIVATEHNEKRKEPRYDTSNAVTFSHVNKEEHYIGIARNISRSGMFFLCSRRLKPKTNIVILPLACHATDLLWGDGEHGMVAESICAIDDRPKENLKHFITMVTARVTRCESLGGVGNFEYGIAVDYIRPMV